MFIYTFIFIKPKKFYLICKIFLFQIKYKTLITSICNCLDYNTQIDKDTFLDMFSLKEIICGS